MLENQPWLQALLCRDLCAAFSRLTKQNKSEFTLLRRQTKRLSNAKVNLIKREWQASIE
jgi:hypothetical protein